MLHKQYDKDCKIPLHIPLLHFLVRQFLAGHMAVRVRTTFPKVPYGCQSKDYISQSPLQLGITMYLSLALLSLSLSFVSSSSCFLECRCCPLDHEVEAINSRMRRWHKPVQLTPGRTLPVLNHPPSAAHERRMSCYPNSIIDILVVHHS